MTQNYARYKKLVREIQKIGIMVPGTIRTVYQFCGKSSCSCASGKPELAHGPYTYWDRKINDKSASVSVKAKHKTIIKKYIANRVKFEKIKNKLLLIGDKIVRNLNSK